MRAEPDAGRSNISLRIISLRDETYSDIEEKEAAYHESNG